MVTAFFTAMWVKHLLTVREKGVWSVTHCDGRDNTVTMELVKSCYTGQLSSHLKSEIMCQHVSNKLPKWKSYIGIII